jgi:hypothetical protein
MSKHLLRGLVSLLLVVVLISLASKTGRIAAQSPPSCLHTATIVGSVVLDKDRDGVSDEREPGIAGWEMIAKPIDKSPCASGDPPRVTTDDEGRFRFAGLVPGTYGVYQDSRNRGPGPERWALYSPNARSVGSGERPWLQPVTIDVTDGATVEVSFLVIPIDGTASISGLFYYDSNRNGVRDPSDALVNTGALISLGYRTPGGYALVNEQDQPLSDVDQLRWRYEFTDLAAGDYVAGVIGPPGRPLNPAASPGGFAETAVTLSRGENVSGLDFGFEPPSVATPIATPSLPARSTPSISAPPTGDGVGSADHSGALWPAAALVATGVVGLALGMQRRARRRAQRG